jgi:catechol 2,3-dioxygenase-like lactoylglutathione lyase family enzyme
MKLGMIVVMTPDLDEARAFYRDVLALSLTAETANQLVFDLGGSEFHVFSCTDAAPAGYRHGATAATVCAFEVASIEAEMRRMTAAGVVFLHARPGENAFSGIRYAAFQAPGGNVHELVERRAA